MNLIQSNEVWKNKESVGIKHYKADTCTRNKVREIIAFLFSLPTPTKIAGKLVNRFIEPSLVKEQMEVCRVIRGKMRHGAKCDISSFIVNFRFVPWRNKSAQSMI